jgi:hypothetical protein
MSKIEINTHEKGIVRKVGYLQTLYRDAAPSTEHNGTTSKRTGNIVLGSA